MQKLCKFLKSARFFNVVLLTIRKLSAFKNKANKMWSKNIIYITSRNTVLHLQHRTFNSTTFNLSNQIQETTRRVKEYVDTPKITKTRSLKKFKDPFPKSFFIGKCDPEVLEYPEVLNLEEIESINNLASQIKLNVSRDFDFKAVDASSSIPASSLQKLSDVHVYGASFPKEYDGDGLSKTETSVINETLSSDGSLFKYVNELRLCGLLLHLFGSEDQKEKYLVPLIHGKTTLALALQDGWSLSDSAASMKTTALPDGEGGYELTGSKLWVYNASLADALIVFAKTAKLDESGQRTQQITSFIIPTNLPGVQIHRPLSKFGVRGVPVCKVELSNVHIGPNAVLGKAHGGIEIATIASREKFDIAPMAVGVGKQVIDHLAKHLINTTFMGVPLSEQESTRTQLAKITMAIYALESAEYLRTGHADLYTNPDHFLELCIIKILASETLQFVLTQALQLFGSEVFVKEELQYVECLLRDTSFYTVCDETNLNLKAAVAIAGLQHAGLNIHEEVRQMRNPLMFPVFIMRRYFEGNKRFGGSRGSNLGLAGYLHPTLKQSANILEYCISRVQMCTEILLCRYGKEIIEKHTELEALGEIAIKAYSLTAVLGRASRSYCIGLADSNTEIEMALVHSINTQRQVENLVRFLDDGPIPNSTKKLVDISMKVLSNKGYRFQSPIARNF